MQTIRQHKVPLLAGVVFIILSALSLLQNNWYILLVPPVLMAIYFAVYYTQYTFLALFFFTPLSVNIEEFTDSFGLFLPTEPMFFGLLLLLVFQSVKSAVFPSYLKKNLIIWAVAVYLIWMFFTAVTSELPIISFKFLLVKLWFIIPVLLYGSRVFLEEKNIRIFLWLFVCGMIISMIYTVFMHSTYSFGEKESHWVMWPFFKDHTIYGAMVAFVFPLILGLYFSKKHPPIVQFILIGLILINLIALYFSYTRAAWLSIVAAGGVWLLIHFRVRFSLLLSVAFFTGIIVAASWTTIEQRLAKNTNEHTTEDFGKRIQSAANVTTDASNLERINRWSCAIDMFKERPVVGFGPGTYAFEYARFQRPENLTIISTNFGDGGNAHSEYLGALAETGLPGMLTVLGIVAAIFYKGIRLYYQIPDEQREMKILILSMILALVTYFVHGFLNNYLDTDKAAVPIWACCACFIAMEYKITSQTEKQNPA